jgi:threonyl-tRNA synthetase
MKSIKNRHAVSAQLSSRSIILFPDEQEWSLDLHNDAQIREVFDQLEDSELKAYIEAEELKGGRRAEPPSINLMRQHELVDYEKASDCGHFRFYPKGKLIFDLLQDWAYEIAVKRFGAMDINSPLLYDWADSEIREQAGSFHENHYLVKPPDSDREFVLRFAGDFGLFKIMQQAKFSHHMLPLRIYEFSKSFRYERSGALSGLKRLRAFHIPDVHSFCKDPEEGWDEYQQLYRHYADLAEGAQIHYAICFRVVEEFYQRHRQKIVELLRYSKRPAFIELLPSMKHYWAVKHEFQAIDSVGGNVQLSTVQLDVRDAEVYGIRFVDSNGQKQGCIICHSSIGSIERWIYAILEEALQRDPPRLPLWLAPAQLRIVPVAPEFIDYCLKLKCSGIRIEVDDSSESLGKKIARANKEWIPYVAVVGQKEIDQNSLMVSERASGNRFPLRLRELEKKIRDRCQERPFRDLSLPVRLSKRPIFYG